MKNRIIPFIVASLIIQCTPQNKQGQDPAKPNIIFILADDLGYGDLGCYGQDSIETPHIDRLAAEGIQFSQHYAGSTVCAPSRCSLMTGLHTGHTAVRGNKRMNPMGQFPLPENTTTVATLLSDAGYQTALIGKWGLGGPGSTGHPNLQGFDYFYGYLCQSHAHNYYPEFLFRNDQKVPLNNRLAEPKSERGTGVAIEKVEYSHDLLVKEAINYLKQVDKDKPFFLYLAVTIPHANNEAKDKGMEVPEYGIYADKNWPEPQKGLAAMITRMDRDIGHVMETLKNAGMDENTIVFFSSDNGPHREGGNNPDFFNSNGPLKGIKRDLYEGGIRVPLIARWPGRIQAGSTSDHISAFWDFLPTTCDIAGIEVVEDYDGISYLPTLLGKAQPQHDYLYWEFHEQNGKQAVRMGPWKGIRLNVKTDPDAGIELYNLELDLREEKDLASENPQMSDLMKKIMKAAHYEDPNWPFVVPAINN